MFQPGFLLMTFGGWVLLAALVVFGYLDHRQLKRNGVPEPFHWAWSFLNPVYPIGRAVVVRRRTGSGIWPMWAAIAVVATGLIISIAFTVYIMQVVFAYVATISTTVT
jgi:hypothetical protein